jgi:MinD-like ATPase involved in chromosome partitioning or flagellar assembly
MSSSGGERYVLLGLAPARSQWFDAVAQWAMSATIPAEFVKCISAEEVRARLASGRAHSAVVVDALAAGFDRDLVDIAARSHVAVLVVANGRLGLASSEDLGVAAELRSDFSPSELLDALEAHCRTVGRADGLPPVADDWTQSLWFGQLIAVCGPGGTGVSTVAAATAQALGTDARYGGQVLLADFALRAEQAMLHDSSQLGPGLQELVECHRLGRPDPDEVRALTFDYPRRGYRLLLGLRQPEGWVALRPRATDAAIAGLRRSFQVVVSDVTGDVEGEKECGSADVEDRNHLARSATRQATVTIAVGTAGLKGVHSLAGLVRRLVRSGVDQQRILAVLNRSPRHPAARASSARALAELLAAAGVELTFAAPVTLPERNVEEVFRYGTSFPEAITRPLSHAVESLVGRLADSAPQPTAPQRIEPGSLGTLAEG